MFNMLEEKCNVNFLNKVLLPWHAYLEKMLQPSDFTVMVIDALWKFRKCCSQRFSIDQIFLFTIG